MSPRLIIKSGYVIITTRGTTTNKNNVICDNPKVLITRLRFDKKLARDIIFKFFSHVSRLSDKQIFELFCIFLLTV